MQSAGYKVQFLSMTQERGNFEAVRSMLLMAECDALIRYPPGSFFSFYAAVLKKRTGPLPETVYELQQASDPTDSLSPALLM